MSYPVYSEYKDSGTLWIGQIPSSWEVKVGKYVFLNKKELNRNLQCMERLALTMNGVIERSMKSADGLQPTDFKTYQIFDEHDLVFKLIDLENFKTSRVGIVHKKGIMSPAYIRLIPNRNIHPKYFYYFYFDLYLRGIYNDIGGQGVRSALNASDLLNLSVCIPSQYEQKQIAAFLDHETTKIDTLIEQSERLISLLREKRQAMISHAVTKGLDPNAPMKDSGIEWLGEIPEHWDTRRIGCISSKITNGYVGPTRDILRENGVRYLQSLHIKDNRIIFNKEYFVDAEWSNNKPKSILKEEDVLIVQTGDIGQVAVVTKEYEGTNCHALIIVSPIKKLISGIYLSWTLNSSYGFNSLKSVQTGALHPHLNCANVKDIYVPIPPIEEQEKIVAFIEEAKSKFDELIDKSQNQIEKLKEHRSALISAAVTGKIDVREWDKKEKAA